VDALTLNQSTVVPLFSGSVIASVQSQFARSCCHGVAPCFKKSATVLNREPSVISTCCSMLVTD
jgi:hypothetical protein